MDPDTTEGGGMRVEGGGTNTIPVPGGTLSGSGTVLRHERGRGDTCDDDVTGGGGWCVLDSVWASCQMRVLNIVATVLLERYFWVAHITYLSADNFNCNWYANPPVVKC